MEQQDKGKNNEEQAVIRGVVQRVTFRNAENGYSIMKVTPEGSAETLTVVGVCPEVASGKHLLIRGVYQTHAKYGKQLAAAVITETQPSTAEGLEHYLGGGVVKGVGPETAKRLVEEFGEKTVEMILQNPERVARVRGVGKKKAQLLFDKLNADQASQESIRFLLEHKLTMGLARKIYEEYKSKTIEVVSRDPYLLARELRGIGFASADSIAMKLGFKMDSPQRLKAGLYHALERASDDGHCYLTVKQVLDQGQVLLGLESTAGLQPALDELVRDEYLVRDDDVIALRKLFRAEEFVAAFVAKRTTPWRQPIIDQQTVISAISRAEGELGLTFSAEQREAVIAAAAHPLLIITGGPGCGKTTIIRAVSTLFKIAGKRLALAAPTGRAAQRMSQVTGLPASTIHRLLKFDPTSGGFLYGANEPLPFEALIIDEASMIDVQLAKDLFSAVPAATPIILVGDRDQLPSVGPGRVFGDLVSLPRVKTIALSRLFRRQGGSEITSVAHSINSGIVPQIPAPDGVTKTDAYFIQRSDPEEAAQLIERLIADQIPKKFNFDPNDICVLTPMNRGPLGTQALNQRIQARINPSGRVDSEQEIEVNGAALRVGDRVCQRVNNYQLDDTGVFNGDLGRVYSVDRGNRKVVVEMWDGRLVTYSDAELWQLSLAYAMTVHRSQGSEIPCVILALHDSHYTLLERQLVYTGVTRAKKLLVIVGSARALQIASRKTTTANRQTRLSLRIDALASEQ